jgi:hypothetical protein
MSLSVSPPSLANINELTMSREASSKSNEVAKVPTTRADRLNFSFSPLMNFQVNKKHISSFSKSSDSSKQLFQLPKRLKPPQNP